MLVLGRRVNQKIVMGDDIEITILEVRGEHVRLGISAPRHVSVYRKEILDQIRDENAEAAVTAIDRDSTIVTCDQMLKVG